MIRVWRLPPIGFIQANMDLSLLPAEATLRHEGNPGAFDSLVCLPGNLLAAGASNDRRVFIWDLASFTLVQMLRGHSLGINALAASPNGRLVSSSSDGTIRIWSRGSACVYTFFAGTSCFKPSFLAALLDGRLVTASADGLLHTVRGVAPRSP